MKTNRLMLLILISKLSFAATSSQRTLEDFDIANSDRVGNGGFAYVCRDTQNVITYARLLDLWEAEELKTYSSNEPVEKQVSDALLKIKSITPNARNFISANLKFLMANRVFVNRPLTKTEDAFPPYIPAIGCSYEQVARYEPVLTETGKRGLRIYNEIYNSPFFTNSDRAALFIHEAIYLTDRRNNNATNSQKSRMLVAHLFSDSLMPNAVRLSFGSLIGLKYQETETTEGVRHVLSSITPFKVPYKLKFESVDGINSYNSKNAKKTDLYQCKNLNMNATDEDSKTGWVSIQKIVGDFSKNQESRVLDGLLISSSFDPEEEESAGGSAAILTLFDLFCEKKDSKGKVSSVPFNVYVSFNKNSECLFQAEDGSISTGSGERCSLRFESKHSKYIQKHMVSEVFEIVRGQPLL